MEAFVAKNQDSRFHGTGSFGEVLVAEPTPVAQVSFNNGLFADDIIELTSGSPVGWVNGRNNNLMTVSVGYLKESADALLSSINTNSGLGGDYNGGTPYTSVALTGDTAVSAQASITLAADGNSIASITVTNPGKHVYAGQTLTIAAGALGSSSAAVTITVQADDLRSWLLSAGRNALLAAASAVTGASAGTYRVSPSTSGSGSGAVLRVVTTGATTISEITVLKPGRQYAPGDTLTVAAAALGAGSSAVTITLTAAHLLGAYALARSRRIQAYRAGIGMAARFTTAFTTGLTGVWQLAGVGSQVDGIYVGMRDGVFNVMRQTAGRPEIVRFRFTAAASSSSTVTITLDGEAVTTAVTSGTSLAFNVAQIANRGKYWGVATTTSGGGSGLTLYVEVADRGERIDAITIMAVGSGYAVGDTVTIGSGALGSSSTAAVITLRERDFNSQGLLRRDTNLVDSITTDVTQGTAKYFGWRTEYQQNAVCFFATVNGAKPGAHSFAAGSTGMTAAASMPEVTQVGTANVQNWVAQTGFNMDRLDGTGPSGIVLAPEYGNVFQLKYKYLGFGALTFEVENPATGKFIPFHQVRYANANTTPSLISPAMYFQLACYNVGYTPAFAVGGGGGCSASTASFMLMLEGKPTVLDSLFAGFATNSGTITGNTETPLIAITNPILRTNTGRMTYVAALMQKIVLTNQHSKTVIFRVYRNPVLSANTSSNFLNWQVLRDNALIKFTTTPSTFAGGRLVEIYPVATNNTREVDLQDVRLTIERDELLLITVASTSVNISAGDVSLAWTVVEDH